MARDLGLCCPLCLDVNDPDDMLPVKIHRKHPPEIVHIHLCADCFQAVIEAVKGEIEARGEASSNDALSGVLPDNGGRGSGDSGGRDVVVDEASAQPAEDHAADDSVTVDSQESTISGERGN